MIALNFGVERVYGMCIDACKALISVLIAGLQMRVLAMIQRGSPDTHFASFRRVMSSPNIGCYSHLRKSHALGF